MSNLQNQILLEIKREAEEEKKLFEVIEEIDNFIFNQINLLKQ